MDLIAGPGNSRCHRAATKEKKVDKYQVLERMADAENLLHIIGGGVWTPNWYSHFRKQPPSPKLDIHIPYVPAILLLGIQLTLEQ